MHCDLPRQLARAAVVDLLDVRGEVPRISFIFAAIPPPLGLVRVVVRRCRLLQLSFDPGAQKLYLGAACGEPALSEGLGFRV